MIQRRIVVLGKNAMAVECLRTILAAGDDVVLALADPSDNGDDGWQPSFRRFASSAGVPVRAVANINDPTFVGEIAALRPDLLLSFQGAQLLKAPLLATPTMGALNLHFGPLPRYRGIAPIAWAIINGEAVTGVSLHHIHVGVDDGPVINAKSVPIKPDDTGRTVYDRCSDAGVELFRESWPRVRIQIPPGVPQVSREALYYNRYSIDFSQRLVSWQADCKTIADWTRALIFPPFQFPITKVGDTSIEISSVRWDRLPHRGHPGQILAVLDDAVMVAAPGGRITLGLRLAGAGIDPTRLDDFGLVRGEMLS